MMRFKVPPAVAMVTAPALVLAFLIGGGGASTADPLVCKPHGHFACPTTSTTSTTSITSTTTSSTSTTSTTSSTTTATGYSCTTSDQQGRCGPYPPVLASATDGSYVDQNVWSPVTGWQQTLYANSPADWQVVANMPAGNTSVVSFANTGQPMAETPVATFTTLTTSFSETMNATPETSGWAMFDVWLNNWGYEVMIQHDFAGNGDCASVASVTFAGQPWHLCDFGNTLAWKLGPDEANKTSEQTGTVDLLAMLTWLETHGYLPAGSNLTNISYGWEICSTGSVPETFTVTGYSLTGS